VFKVLSDVLVLWAKTVLSQTLMTVLRFTGSCLPQIHLRLWQRTHSECDIVSSHILPNLLLLNPCYIFQLLLFSASSQLSDIVFFCLSNAQWLKNCPQAGTAWDWLYVLLISRIVAFFLFSAWKYLPHILFTFISGVPKTTHRFGD
jgi:hypothetical protein